MKRFFANANYDFLGLRRRAFAFSGAWIAAGLLLALVWQFSSGSWLNYGVDFAGGTLIQVQFSQPVSEGELRPVLDAVFPGTTITAFGGQNEFLIRAPVTGEATSDAAEVIPPALTERFGEIEIDRIEAVGAKVGGELQGRAALAIMLSFAATLVYLAFRFEWRFGLAAVIATAHDIVLTLGFIAATRIEVALPTVAAVLTIVGYSLNDTIVVFDRIRENLHSSARREDFTTILNRSINETLPRTVLTTTTTLVTLVALALFGGVIIRDFAVIMIVGIVLGTYSSIFVAAPALLLIEQRWPGERKKARVQRPARATV